MRILTLTLGTLMVSALISPALAEDGFGSYFSNQAPSGFSDAAPDALAEVETPNVADIEPAAGEETNAPAPVMEAPATEAGTLQRIQEEIEDAISP